MNKFYLFMLDLTYVESGERVLVNAQSITSLSSPISGDKGGTVIFVESGLFYHVKEPMDEIIKKLKKLYLWPTTVDPQGDK